MLWFLKTIDKFAILMLLFPSKCQHQAAGLRAPTLLPVQQCYSIGHTSNLTPSWGQKEGAGAVLLHVEGRRVFKQWVS